MNTNHKNTSHMKKTFLSIIIAVMAIGVGHAQIKEGMIAQPTHIVGKRIDAVGEVTSTMEADFTYNEDGRPQTFTIPDYGMHTYYTFNDEYFSKETTCHEKGHPQLIETLSYTYEEGKIKTIEYTWSHGYEYPINWVYTYGEDGRLARKDYLYGIPGAEEFTHHYLYEYADGGKTKIENLRPGMSVLFSVEQIQ